MIVPKEEHLAMLRGTRPPTSGLPRWSAANSALIAVFNHGSSIQDAKFDSQENRLLTIGEDGVVQLWDNSFDPGASPEEYILEFEVRTATTLATNGTVRTLTEVEWAEKRRELNRLRSAQKATPSFH
jgi:WD40 repeat protein